MLPAIILSVSGVAVAGMAFYNRAKPDWQRRMGAMLALAVGQVALGVLAYLVLR